MKIIVMYHYVRESGMGLTPAAFSGQLDFLGRHYAVMPLSRLMAYDGSDPACAITFDDGLKDAVRGALPALRDHGFGAAFFVPGGIFDQRGRCLDVQRRHLLMMHLPVDEIIAGINRRIPEHLAIRPTPAMQADYLDDLLTASMKWTLDHLDPEIVSPILEALVAEHLGDEQALFDDTYLSADDVRTLLGAGMEIGGHGQTHRPLGKLYHQDQHRELADCARVLRGLIGDRPLTISYPSGDYTPITLRIAGHLGFRHGYTIKRRTVEDSPQALEIGRFDCNAIPLPEEFA